MPDIRRKGNPTDIEWPWVNLWEELVGEAAAQTPPMPQWPKGRLRSKADQAFGLIGIAAPSIAVLPNDERFRPKSQISLP
jgi:hypothetical protein